MLTALQLHWKWALLSSAGSDKHRTRCRGTGCQLYDLNYLNYWLQFTRSLYNSNPVTYTLSRYFICFNIYTNYVIIYIDWLFIFERLCSNFRARVLAPELLQYGTTRSRYVIYGLRYRFQIIYLFI